MQAPFLYNKENTDFVTFGTSISFNKWTVKIFMSKKKNVWILLQTYKHKIGNSIFSISTKLEFIFLLSSHYCAFHVKRHTNFLRNQIFIGHFLKKKSRIFKFLNILENDWKKLTKNRFLILIDFIFYFFYF